MFKKQSNVLLGIIGMLMIVYLYMNVTREGLVTRGGSTSGPDLSHLSNNSPRPPAPGHTPAPAPRPAEPQHVDGISYSKKVRNLKRLNSLEQQ